MDNKQILLQYIKQHFSSMMEKPAGLLNRPVISCGFTTYGGQLWDYSLYCDAKSLINLYRLCRNDADVDAGMFYESICRHGKGSVEIFLDLQEEDGFIPMMESVTGEWFSTYRRIQKKNGGAINQHKPFLCRNVKLVADFAQDKAWMRQAYDGLRAYLAYYYRNQWDSRTGLFFYRNDAMIGWDNDPCVFGRPDDSCAEIHINSFLFSELQTMAGIADELGFAEDRRLYQEKAAALGDAVQRYCYDKRDGFYYSVDLQVSTHRTELLHRGMGAFWYCIPLKIRTWGGFLPMAAGLATPEQAERIVCEHYHDPQFLSPHGIRSLAADEPMYNTENSANPSNWLGPVWIPASYFVFRGLLNYGYRREAEDLCVRTINLLARDITEHGGVSESYVPETGAPMLYTGDFLDFNLLAVSMIAELEHPQEK